jgi:hypothetical protein
MTVARLLLTGLTAVTSLALLGAALALIAAEFLTACLGMTLILAALR